MMTEEIYDLIINSGASLVGFAGLDILDPEVRKNFKTGISIAVALDPHIIAGITEGPTREYHEEYVAANSRLDMLSNLASEYLCSRGNKTDRWGATDDRIYGHNITDLPHKTMATLSGLGWIGKCALLVTKEFGSAVRFTTVLTDMDLTIEDHSIKESLCGDCSICVNVCPSHAPKGLNWTRGLFRDDFFDPDLCRTAARKLAMDRTGIELTYCGICIANCPHTLRYIERSV
jgi:epoxyqueuosine reductase